MLKLRIIREVKMENNFEDNELEAFSEEEEDESLDDAPVAPIIPGSRKQPEVKAKSLPAKKVEQKQEPKVEEAPQEAQPQYVAVPRAVPIETMLNELYDGQQELRQGQQEIKQVILAILEKLK